MSPDSSSVVAVRRSLQCLLAALLLASNAANATAQQIPAGCSTSAVSISIEVFAADQVTPITVATLGQKTVSGRYWKEMLKPQIRIRSARQFPTFDEETTTRNDGVQLSYGLGWALLKTPHGRAFFKGGHDDGWENYMIGFDKSGTGVVFMTNSSNGESIFKELLATLIGDTYTPWEWEGYIPWNAAVR